MKDVDDQVTVCGMCGASYGTTTWGISYHGSMLCLLIQPPFSIEVSPKCLQVASVNPKLLNPAPLLVYISSRSLRPRFRDARTNRSHELQPLHNLTIRGRCRAIGLVEYTNRNISRNSEDQYHASIFRASPCATIGRDAPHATSSSEQLNQTFSHMPRQHQFQHLSPKAAACVALPRGPSANH